MIRVAYIVSTLKRCGPSNQLRNIIGHLDRTQFEPLVITLSPESADSVMSLYEQDGIPICSLELSRFSGLFLSRAKLRDLLREMKVDLLHTQGLRADSLAASLRDEWPAVCSVRNFPQLDYPMTYGTIRGYWMAHTHTRALGRVAAPVGVSSAVAHNLTDCFDVGARTICNGVDTAIWTPASPDERAALRQKLNVAEETALWVSVGHLSERKDPLAVIAAFRQADLPNAKLVFLGSGPLEAECRRAADGCEQIMFAGRVENVSDWLRAADGFISASLAEGFPNAVLEALACGLPCLLSDIPPHQELANSCVGHASRIRERVVDTDSLNTEKPVLQDSSECVRLFPHGDVMALRNFEPNESLRVLARVSAEEKFSAAAMSETYQGIYRELLRA